MASPSSKPIESSTTTTLPSGKLAEPSDSITPSPKIPPSNKRSQSAASSIAAAPARADAFLAHLQRCLQTRAGADAVLLFLCYSFRLGGSVLETLSKPILRLSARRLVAAAFKLPPATTVVLAATPPHPPLAALALRLGGRLKAVAAMISETRTMGRLWGLLGLYFAAKRLVLKTCGVGGASGEKTQDSEADRLFDTLLAYAQVVSLIVFQGAENLSYLAGKKVLPFPAATQGRLSLISVRCWGMYVGMEVSRLLIERSRRVSSSSGDVKDAQWMADWRKRFLRNLAWAPLTVHWSTPNGILPDVVVSLLAAYPATSGMLDLWRDTA